MTDQPLKPILETLFTNLSSDELSERSKLVNVWPVIAGKHVAEHTKPRFSDDGKVTVWVDDSTLAFEISRRYKTALLKRLQNEFGIDKVKDIRFFVGQLR